MVDFLVGWCLVSCFLDYPFIFQLVGDSVFWDSMLRLG